jgi:hypothetical protein
MNDVHVFIIRENKHKAPLTSLRPDTASLRALQSIINPSTSISTNSKNNNGNGSGSNGSGHRVALMIYNLEQVNGLFPFDRQMNPTSLDACVKALTRL